MSAISWGPATPLLNYIGKTPLTEEILEVQSGIDRIISLFGESESAELVEDPGVEGLGEFWGKPPKPPRFLGSSELGGS